ncbi:hypothetical protein GCM10023221_31380 [Luteimicrobium xylanilyticum]|uniref:Uncharacterized protein n=1 Tax=Luteimicrobium xylanilyticum TaxID=1133546 RepID=A0A5P9Q5D9_9MICO|nr:hypothetical protein [Luteimicrobium xylanilyticum]QFU96573.1 hypothetical protein KDY119_00057 [Luteimicrobium xylanilyticum]
MSADASERAQGAPHDALPEGTAERLRERVYVAFVSLAVVLTLNTHAAHLDAGRAAGTLVVTALGTVAAAFAADLISHLAVHGTLPARSELRLMLRVSFGALGSVVVPLVLIGLAGAGAWSVTGALTAAAAVLTATLGVVGWIGVRRTGLTALQKLAALGALVLLGVVVVALKLLAH